MCMSGSAASRPGESGGNPKSGSNDYSLEIVKQPQQHVFVNEWFTVEVHLSSDQQEVSSPLSGGHLRLQAQLYMHDGTALRGEASPDVAQLIIDPSTPLTIPLEQEASKWTAITRCKIDASLGEDVPLSIAIKFSSQDISESSNISSVSTNPVHLVSHKLVAEATDWEKIWYKDEGGRDKCMQVQVSLRRRDDSPVYNVRVPLKLVLRYADDLSLKVQKQNFLRVLGSPKHYIDPETGKTTLRFRIEDVSKNHQGQNFRVEVRADPSKFPNISPAFTPTVNVRSKRNKRARQYSDSGDSERAAPSAPHHARHHYPHEMPMQSPATSRPPHPLPPGYRGGPPERPQHVLRDVSDITRLRDAMQGIIRWTDEVVNGLYQLQWQVIGYAPFPDGTVDYSHPYHSMPNPNSCISKVLSMYSNSAREDLRVLMNAVENTVGQQRQGLANVPGGEIPGSSPPDYASSVRPHAPVEDTGMLQVERGRSYDSYQEKPHYSTGHMHHGPPGGGQAPPLGRAYAEGVQASHFGASQASGVTLQPAQQQIPPQSEVEARMKEAPPLKAPVRPKVAATGPQIGVPEAADDVDAMERLQAEVAYVLAKQYKALRTGERLGFPAFNEAKEILGFYQESSTKVGVERFLPISKLKDDFGPMERAQAKQIMIDAIRAKSDAVHSIRDWGSVTNLVDNALVYDWSKNVLDASGSGSPSF